VEGNISSFSPGEEFIAKALGPIALLGRITCFFFFEDDRNFPNGLAPLLKKHSEGKSVPGAGTFPSDRVPLRSESVSPLFSG